MSPSRLAWLDVAKGISIVMVVVHHSYLFAHGVEFSWHAFKITDIMLPLFFLAAGLTTSFGLRQPWPAYLVRRVLPILWMYLIWTLLYGLFNDHVATLFPWVNNGRTVSILKAAYWPWGNLWFVWVLLVLCLGVRLVTWLPPLLVVGLSFALAIADNLGALSLGPLARLPGVIHALISFQPFFMLGALYPTQILALAASARQTRILGLGALAVLLVTGALTAFAGASQTLRLAAGTGVGLALSMAIVQLAPLCRISVLCGQKSLAIFLGHQIFLALFYLWIPVALATGGPGILAASVIAVMLSLGTYDLAQRIGLGWLYVFPREAGQTLWHRMRRVLGAS